VTDVKDMHFVFQNAIIDLVGIADDSQFIEARLANR
jgi:hypothetical protein